MTAAAWHASHLTTWGQAIIHPGKSSSGQCPVLLVSAKLSHFSHTTVGSTAGNVPLRLRSAQSCAQMADALAMTSSACRLCRPDDARDPQALRWSAAAAMTALAAALGCEHLLQAGKHRSSMEQCMAVIACVQVQGRMPGLTRRACMLWR